MKSRLLGALYTCVAFIAFSMPAKAVPPSELIPYAVDMHLHGHSNHNAGIHPASMEYHSAQAVLTGYVDVLWWTDHTRMFDQWNPFSFDTGSARVEEATLDITGLPLVGTSNATHLAASLTGGTPSVRVDSGSALIQLQTDAGTSEFQFLSYEAKDSRLRFGNVAGFRFNRPLTSEPIADVELECDSPGAAAVCEVEFGLAWHHEENQPVQQKITYRIDSQASERQSTLLTPSHVQIVIPPQTGGHYLFDLLSDATPLENGDDNTISRFILRVGAHSGTLASMTFRGITITSEKPSDLHQIGAVQGLARRYEGLFGLQQPVGLEFGTEQGHLNGFLPRPIDERDLDLFDVVQGVRHGLKIKDWAARVQDRAGIVSLNHPFGPGTACGSVPPAQCVLDRAQTILDQEAYGADLLEVGYINRGASLRDHLDLWDILTANELLLYGTGVSDNHGVPWERLRTYVTWVLSPSAEPPDLLDSLKAGRIFYGNPKVWKGTFSLQVGDAYMGDRIPNPGGTRLVQFQLDPWPESVEVYLVQGLIKPGMEVEYLHDRTPLIQGQAIIVDTSRPSFVRLEAYEAYEELGDLSKAAMFTNPVTMLPNPDSVSGNDGDTELTDNPKDSNSDGLSDADARALRLNPNDPDGDTDGDGISDAIEVGRDVNHPLDNDLDGIIDALEPGASAADAGIASGLPLPSGNTVTIMTAEGEMLSKVSTAAVADESTGINFPFGSISYTTSSPVSGSVTVRMAFSIDLPNDLVLYKMNNTGALTELPTSRWTRVNSGTVDITLTDGDRMTDLDAVTNGSIEDPVVLSAASPPSLTPGSGGGGGGCILNTPAGADPSFPLLLLALLGYWLKRSFLDYRTHSLHATNIRRHYSHLRH